MALADTLNFFECENIMSVAKGGREGGLEKADKGLTGKCGVKKM